MNQVGSLTPMPVHDGDFFVIPQIMSSSEVWLEKKAVPTNCASHKKFFAACRPLFPASEMASI
jgi:hypothetical protein